MTPKMPSVAILGATGAVGQEFINLIEERNFPYSNLKLLASKRSAGKTMTVKGKEYIVEEACPDSFKGVEGTRTGGRSAWLCRHRQLQRLSHGAAGTARRAGSKPRRHCRAQGDYCQSELFDHYYAHGFETHL